MQILAILKDAEHTTKQGIKELGTAARGNTEGTVDQERLLRDIHDGRHYLRRLRRRIERVRCHTRAGRRGKSLTIHSLELTETALGVFHQAVLASDPATIKRLGNHGKQLTDEAQRAGRRGHALLER